jgi:hypothetical protein
MIGLMNKICSKHNKESIEAELEAGIQELKKNRKIIEAELRELVWGLIHNRREGK